MFLKYWVGYCFYKLKTLECLSVIELKSLMKWKAVYEQNCWEDAYLLTEISAFAINLINIFIQCSRYVKKI